ncbi:MAG: hypothetical protein DRQ55_12510 [Planctomycetota bacterium]|nr:MAG: hypothetical protein DRQ55_12510 [Planctomycetota bacterium]
MPNLSPEEREQLAAAAALHRPLARAASLGRKNGLSLLVFGLATLLLSALGPDVVGLAIGAVVTVTGFIERRVATRLCRADEGAPLILARNELALLAGIVLYAGLKLTWLRESGAELARQIGDTGGLGVDIEALAQSLNTAVYATVIAVALVYQGGMARYFLRRRQMIAVYRAQAPAWARQIVEQLGE